MEKRGTKSPRERCGHSGSIALHQAKHTGHLTHSRVLLEGRLWAVRTVTRQR